MYEIVCIILSHEYDFLKYLLSNQIHGYQEDLTRTTGNFYLYFRIVCMCAHGHIYTCI